jgi:type IV secretory pathway VirJ component
LTAVALVLVSLIAADAASATAAAAPAQARSHHATAAPRNLPPAPRLSLPVIEQRAPAPGRDVLAVILTGDGGWAPADKGIAAALTAEGVDVVALDSRRYLMQPRTPDEAGSDLEQLLRYYLAAWGKERVAIIGYSRGAELAPFMAARLAPDLRRRLAVVALLGPSEWANFQFHWIDLVKDKSRGTDLPVRPELEKLRGTPLLCIYGATDGRSICPTLDPTLVRAVARERHGHFVHKGEGGEIAEWALDELGRN